MFTDINIDKRYRSNKNNIPCDFMIPMLMNATKYKRAVGYFSTSSLVNLSVGLAEMAKRGGHIEVVCSPKLSQEDLEAINYGYKAREKAFIEALDISLTNPVDEFEEERLNMVATLVAQGSLKFKLAFMERDTGINVYHEKIAVAYDENGNRISFTGSMNESENGLMNNFESIVVFCDWKSEDQKQYIDEVEADFELLWKDNTEKVRVIEFPQIIIEKLLKFQKTQVDYDIEQKQFGADLKSLIKKKFVTMPSGISLMAYQKEAILKWREQEYIGIYDMATGTGKTYTALGSIEYLAKELENQIAVFILCPYVHLVGQWEEDVLAWGGKPIIAHSQSPDKQWEQHLIDSYKRFKTIKKPFVCITTNDTYTGDRLQSIIQNIKADMNVLLIVDEAHNVGAQKISRFLNENIKYRLALSATIERYQDKKGTEIIFKYFKEKCIEYSLNKAIEEGKALCNYEYHVIYSFLSPQELDRYNRITKELKNYMKYDNGRAKYTKAAQVKLFERKRILAGAKDKVGLLKEAMGAYRNEKHILVYCGATNITAATLDYLIEHGTCVCGNIIGEKEKEYIEELRKLIPPNVIGSYVGQYQSKLEEWKLETEDFVDELKKKAELIEGTKAQIDDDMESKVRLEKIIDGKINFSLERKKMNANKESESEELRKINQYKFFIEETEKKIRTLKSDLERETAHTAENRKIQQMIMYAKALYEMTSEMLKRREEPLMEELNVIIKEKFAEMFHEKEKYAQMGEDYRLHLFYYKMGNGEPIEELALSEGEIIARNFVFIVSILELAQKKKMEDRQNNQESDVLNLPLVLDGPFSKLGDVNTGLIAKVLPKVAEQVIVFMLDKDWEASGLEKYTLPEYRYFVKKDADENSATLERR